VNLARKHPLAFVPTMGALHAGHESLIAIARKCSTSVVVSIFVNPLQFENPDDLANYPRSLSEDQLRAELAGASEVWAPTVEEIYPAEVNRISAGELGSRFEGEHRLGHFDGMLTVVNRLFELVQPQWAIFGEKDYQQLFLVRKLVADLQLPIEIVSAPIIRDSHGLALSSRNVRLSASDSTAAYVISRALNRASQLEGLSEQRTCLHEILATEPRFTLDYAEIIDEANFEIATPGAQRTRALVSGWVAGVRLIDNMAMKVSKVG